MTKYQAGRDETGGRELTSEDFNLEATAIANRFLGMQSTTINEAFIKAAFQQLIYRFYETGGYLLDRLYQPILDVEDVEILVDRHQYKVSIVIDRKRKPVSVIGSFC